MHARRFGAAVGLAARAAPGAVQARQQPGAPRHLAVRPGGDLYVSADAKGRIGRISYMGQQ